MVKDARRRCTSDVRLLPDALMAFTNGDLMVTGDNATANIFASYPATHLSTLNGFVDQVQDSYPWAGVGLASSLGWFQ